MVFLNKLDRSGASFKHSLLSLLSHRLHPNPMALALPISSFEPQDYKQAEPGVQGLVDLVQWEIWKWSEDGDSSRSPLPRNMKHLKQLDALPPSHPIIDHLEPARRALLDNLAMVSDEFMSLLLKLPPDPSSYLGIDTSIIIRHLRNATLHNKILPVVCGSATKHIGTELAMDYIGRLFASPLDIEHDVQSRSAPLRVLAWKVCWDRRRGWMTFVRVYSGTFCLSNPINLLTSLRRPSDASNFHF